MTRDDIIAMAREAGLWPAVTDTFPAELERFAELVRQHTQIEQMPKFDELAVLVAKQEREACIKSLENIAAKAQEISADGLVWRTVQECANAIRERGQA